MNVGEYIKVTCQAQENEKLSSDNVIINLQLLKEEIIPKENGVIKRKHGSKKKKVKNRYKIRKGKTVLFLTDAYWKKKKRGILRVRKSRNCNAKLSSAMFAKIINDHKIPKIIKFLILRTVKYCRKFLHKCTLAILLIIGNVERNPGPTQTKGNDPPSEKINLKILTYNCNGLGDRKKLKRLMIKVNKVVDKGGIVLLQETHILDRERVTLLTNHKVEISSFTSNSAGVLTIFNNEYEKIYSFSDGSGRKLFTLIKVGNEQFLVVNIYSPNDHKKAIDFVEEVYIKILQILNDYPDTFVIVGGDFNSCMTSKDFLNRNKSKAETELTNAISNNNEMCGLIDSFSTTESAPGYTWNRGRCYSRLDYIYVSKELRNRLGSARVDWAFEKSDHAALSTLIRIKEEIIKGKGIAKVNTEILKDPQKVIQIREELKYLINQIPNYWDGHMKLEYLKVSIRSTFAKYVGVERSEMKDNVKELEISLNNIEEMKLKLLNKVSNVNLVNNLDERLGKIETAKRTIMNELDIVRNKLTEKIDFQARAKWFEFGEKSNKFFLNLNKFRSKQSIIEIIKDGLNTYIGQANVMEGIRNFYSELYRKVTINLNDDPTFFDECPNLTNEQRTKMDDEISLAEMHKALLSCKDSAPGPDGIPYSVYKTFWDQTGHILKEAWEYSMENGNLPISHKESVITILPKEGKDKNDIKNWRPITLTNCDAKVITKALAMRLNPILESIIDPSQTAYVPGRSVMDNLRANRFLKNHCESNHINAVLVSLDAKKAFDSVDHEYINKVLIKYGFGQRFRLFFKTLYSDISARILVNGYFSEKINIERGVKQGDALSCAIFILCIDPLLRNINKNDKIKPIELITKNSKLRCIHKACGFADDISIICSDDQVSINEIFAEYQRLTNKSGLTLNADKTEILSLKQNAPEIKYKIKYNNCTIEIKNSSSIKICGIFYCNNKEEENQHNITDKIDKLKLNLKKWNSRNLTMEGRSLLVKTFGISQLIYNMQCIKFDDVSLKRTEQYIFNFIWGKKDIDDIRARDRIKRSTMKNSYKNGGLNITDIYCLNNSLKLRQYIRASHSKHNISIIQRYCCEKSGSNEVLEQEFLKVTKEDEISESAQKTINILTDCNRENRYRERSESIESNIAIKMIANTKIGTYLDRKKRVFLKCIYATFQKEGIKTFFDLVREAETEINSNRSKRLESIICAFPNFFRDATNTNIAETHENNKNSLTHILNIDSSWIPIESITTKELQLILKNELGRITTENFGEKLEINNLDPIDFVQFRHMCKNSKLRNIHFRLAHKDFFTYQRMFKFKMTITKDCPRCKMVENTKHLLWDCIESRKIWKIHNEVLKSLKMDNMLILKYEDLYRNELNSASSLIKIRIIQEFIQINRPINWNLERHKNLICQIMNTEIFNGCKNREIEKVNRKWSGFLSLNN